MNAVIVSGRETQRVPLHTVVPLSVPFHVAISPSDFCNFNCSYCGQSKAPFKGSRIMPWDDFVVLVNQIERLCSLHNSKVKMFQFVGYGEPLLNTRITDMVRYVRDLEIAEKIDITTNASLLTNSFSIALIEAGLTRLSISVQGVSSAAYQKVCGKDIPFEKFVDNIRFFYEHRGKCEVYLKTLDICLPAEEDKREFLTLFSGICDKIYVENCIELCEDVDYSKVGAAGISGATRYGTPHVSKMVCDTLFYSVLITSWGDVTPCCKYPMLSLGNTFKTPFSEIWNGTLHCDYMRKHLNGEKDTIPLCKDCVSLSLNNLPEDNLDEYRFEVLKKLNIYCTSRKESH